MPGAFLEVERLIDRAVHIQQEVNAQAALLQDLETAPAESAAVVVQHELIHVALQLA